MQCVAGCMPFDGGERKHHRSCPYYPESLPKMWHDTEAELIAEIKRLRVMAYLPSIKHAAGCDCIQCVPF